MLTMMVREVYQKTRNKRWLKLMLPSLIKEYEYWTSAPIQVAVQAECDDDNVHFLSRYYSANKTPRPESYYEVNDLFLSQS